MILIISLTLLFSLLNSFHMQTSSSKIRSLKIIKQKMTILLQIKNKDLWKTYFLKYILRSLTVMANNLHVMFL